MNKYTIKFESTPVGHVSCGSMGRVVVSTVKYRDQNNSPKSSCDIRVNSYAMSSNKYNPSRKGLSLNVKYLVPIFNVLANLKDNPPTQTVPQMEVGRVTKNDKYDIVISLCKTERSVFVDIREFVTDSNNGYTGFTYKGVRVVYEFKDDLAKLIFDAHSILTKEEEEPI